MKQVFDFVNGKLSFDEFETELSREPELWESIQKLVPDDIENTTCKFRESFGNMKAFETNNYRVKSTVTAFGFNGIMAHSLIGSLVKYNYPSVVIRTPIENSERDIMNKLKLDFIGGHEVDDFIREILVQCKECSIKELKQVLKGAFYISSKKHPEWVQEPEWPMLNGMPMKFVSQSKDGELSSYLFEDIKTGERRVIEQYL